MKKLAEKLVESMMKYGTLSNEDKGIYVFGIYQTMVSALEILLMLVTGILCGVGWQCVMCIDVMEHSIWCLYVGKIYLV